MSTAAEFTRIDEARRGENPTVVARLSSGWVFLGDTQFLPGYCVLFADPVVESLNVISGTVRAQFLEEMALLGDAVQAVTGAFRINYSVLGNLLPILHAHVFPRYDWEPESSRLQPVWLYPKAQRDQPVFDLDRDAVVMGRIHDELVRRGAAVADLAYPWRT